MKKRYLFLLIALIIIPNIKTQAYTGSGVNRLCNDAGDIITNEDWTTNTSLKLTEIAPTRVLSVYAGINLNIEGKAGYGLYTGGHGQGFTASNKYYVFIKAYESEDYCNDMNTYPCGTNSIMVINKETNTFLKDNGGFQFGHGNDATWNSKDDIYYVLNDYSQSSTNSNTGNKIDSFKISSTGTITNHTSKTVSRCFGGIAYNDDDDSFVARGCIGDNKHNTIFILDKNFNIKRQFDLKWNHLYPQGLSYSNGYIYMAASESANSKNIYCYYNENHKYDSLIYQYDLNGNFIKTLYIPKSKLNGEIQSIEIDDNNIFYGGFDMTFKNANIIFPNNENKDCKTTSCSTQSVYTTTYLSEIKTATLTINDTKVYKKNSNLNTNNSYMNVTYNSGNTEKINLSDSRLTITGFDSSSVGKKEIKVTYKNQEPKYNVWIVDNYEELDSSKITRIAHLKKGENIKSNSNVRYQNGDTTINNSDGIKGMTIVKNGTTEYIYFAVLGNDHSNTALYKMTTSGTNLSKSNDVFLGAANDLTFNPNIDTENGGVIVSGHSGNECCLADKDNQTLSEQCPKDSGQYICNDNTIGYEYYNNKYNLKGMISYISTQNTSPFIKRRANYEEYIHATPEQKNNSNEAIFDSIAYDKDNQLYYARRSYNNYLWILNANYNSTSKKYDRVNTQAYSLKNIVDANIRGWAYYKGLLYLAIYGGNNGNIIMAYNLKGNLENIYHFPDNTLNVNLRIAGIDFDENGNMYLGFNNADDSNYVEFYKCLTPTTSKEEYLNYSNTINIDNTNNIIKYLSNNITFDTLINKIDTNINYQMLDKNNKTKLRSSTLNTGDKIKYNLNNKEQINTISITGDVTGRGLIDNEDVIEAYRLFRKKITETELSEETAYTIAADTVKDEQLEINDIAKLYYYVEKKISSLD